MTMTDASLLSYPKPDAPTNIMTDASNTAVGAVLQQQNEDVWAPKAFFSRTLKPDTALLTGSYLQFT